MTEQIIIEGMEFYAYHGFYPEEHEKGARYTVDLTLTVDMGLARESDELTDTINYETVYDIVAEQMRVESSLIEHVASRIYKALYSAFAQLKEVDLHLYKYNPPLKGPVKRTGIRLKG